jgi:GNAT superfamily N-acetyltransferase
MALHQANAENNPVNPVPYQIRPLRAFQHWKTVGEMYRNYPGVDSNFDRVLDGFFRRPFLRWLGMPFYFWLANQGFGLWLENDELAGQIYLQHRKMVTHINDLEVNRPYQGRGLSRILLDFAEQEAQLHKKAFLTLAVTLSNSRAVTLYRKTDFLDQHHSYFYLSRAWWSEPAARRASSTGAGVRLAYLDRQRASRHLQHWFEQEIRVGEPQTFSVWEALYRPELPHGGQGFSFALYWGDNPTSQGHADFFDWGNRGRWRVYVDPSLWGSAAERALFEALLHQAQGYEQLGLMVGSSAHHTAARTFTRDLGLIERDTERMLMIRPLTSSTTE